MFPAHEHTWSAENKTKSEAGQTIKYEWYVCMWAQNFYSSLQLSTFTIIAKKNSNVTIRALTSLLISDRLYCFLVWWFCGIEILFVNYFFLLYSWRKNGIKWMLLISDVLHYCQRTVLIGGKCGSLYNIYNCFKCRAKCFMHPLS